MILQRGFLVAIAPGKWGSASSDATKRARKTLLTRDFDLPDPLRECGEIRNPGNTFFCLHTVLLETEHD